MAFSYKVRVALALEASARLSSLLLLIVSSTFRSPYDRTHVHLHLTLPRPLDRVGKNYASARDNELAQCVSAFQ